MVQEQIHKALLLHAEELCQWYKEKKAQIPFPVYSSFDIRESNFKISPVDANIFPAGFNNICSVDRESSIAIIDQYIKNHYDPGVKVIGVLAEEHTNNTYYWENINAIVEMLKPNYEVQVIVPKELAEDITVTAASGKTLVVSGCEIQDNKIKIKGQEPDLVLCNNDFSTIYDSWKSQITTAMNPPFQLGWYQRKKSAFFTNYNQFVAEISEIIKVNPFLLQVQTKVFSNFDIASEDSRAELATQVDQFIADLKGKYEQLEIKQEPFVFIKNNSGTYGLGITKVHSGEEVLKWNYKERKKMKAAKGGNTIMEVIIQEGIPTRFSDEAETAEATIYMIGCELSGGFLRAHSKKGPNENLNSPGAIYKRLCVSDLELNSGDLPMENIYGFLAKLGVLAIGYEAKESAVDFQNFKLT